MMIGQEKPTPINAPILYAEAERAPTAQEMALWDKAQKLAKRVNLLSYVVKAQYKNILLIHQFATDHKITLDEPELPELEKRMMIAFAEIENLKERMCETNQLELGVRLSSNGQDLDIVEPTDVTTLGWIIPAIAGAVIVIGIIARWAYLEKEIVEVTADFNGILKRSDMALCSDPDSQTCKDWEAAKSSGGYYKRESIIDSVKNAAAAVGTVAKKGLGAGLALAIPLLLWMYLPRRRREG